MFCNSSLGCQLLEFRFWTIYIYICMYVYIYTYMYTYRHFGSRMDMWLKIDTVFKLHTFSCSVLMCLASSSAEFSNSAGSPTSSATQSPQRDSDAHSCNTSSKLCSNAHQSSSHNKLDFPSTQNQESYG